MFDAFSTFLNQSTGLIHQMIYGLTLTYSMNGKEIIPIIESLAKTWRKIKIKLEWMNETFLMLNLNTDLWAITIIPQWLLGSVHSMATVINKFLMSDQLFRPFDIRVPGVKIHLYTCCKVTHCISYIQFFFNNGQSHVFDGLSGLFIFFFLFLLVFFKS